MNIMFCSQQSSKTGVQNYLTNEVEFFLLDVFVFPLFHQ